MKRVAIIGSGNLGQQIVHLAISDHQFIPVGFFDDFEGKGEEKFDLPILGGTDEIVDLFNLGKFDVIICAIGYNNKDFRMKIVHQLVGKIPFATLIHSTCIIDPTAKIGQGSVLYPGCVVDMDAVISENVLMYSACLLSHNSFVGSNSILSPGVKIAGFSKIGESVHLGIGTIVSDSITIVDKTITGAGTVVVKSITEAGTYVGIPSKLIQR